MLNDIIGIYSQISDELSKRIYLCRLNYSISKDKRYIEELVDITVRNSNEWKNYLSYMEKLGSREMVLFGKGIWGQILLSEMKNFHFKCIIDNSSDEPNETKIPIVNANSFLSEYNGEKIVISSYKNREAMIAQCKSFGVRDADMIDASAVIYGLTEGRIYFDDAIPMNVGNGVFIDGGCFDGSDTKRYMGRYQGRVMCFEPDAENVERILQNLNNADLKKYKIIQKGLWSSSGKAAFESGETYGSHIELNATGNEVVEIGTIDDEIGESRVSMIKMDIEGAELEALKGARKVVERDRPILAISIYHKPEDIIEIPEYILSLFNGYKLYLRHYSFSWYDTVLYAVPKK